MAFIPPIVSPLLQMVKDLAAALNETRGYLGLTPIDADALIAKAYGEAPAVPVVTPVDKPNAGVQQGASTQKPETKPEPVVVDAPVCTPDGKYGAPFVSRKGSKVYFEPNSFKSSGLFCITIAGGKATFTVKPQLDDDERNDWDSIGADACEGDFQPLLNDSPKTITPGEAKFEDGLWVITRLAEIE